MNKICTDIEQSKKLLEIGIDVNTADMFYRDNEVDVKLMWEHLPDVQVTNPAWSLVALLELLDDTIDMEDGDTLNLEILKEDSEYHIAYHSVRNRDIEYETGYYDDFIDAAFEMVCWLKENEKI